MTIAWTVHEGDALDVLAAMPAASVDLCIADPPYSSGGMMRGDRASPDTTGKYSRAKRSLEVLGDTRDQRQWLAWAGAWLRSVARVCKPGAIVAVFVDWRQLPLLTDAFGLGGLVMRGIAVWHKRMGRPQPGRPRQECEFIVWGTVGGRKRVGGWQPGLYTETIGSRERDIFCQKPVALLRKLVQWAPAGSVILDPFAGSGTTGEAAVLEGRQVVLIDSSQANAEHCRRRLEALDAPPTGRTRSQRARAPAMSAAASKPRSRTSAPRRPSSASTPATAAA